MTPVPDRIICFDDFELDRHTLELRRGGVPVKLQQQPARVLAVLTEHAGDLVSRDDLRKAVWNDDTFVDFDRGLNYCVNQIRAALGDTADEPRYLETLRGRGYRFIGRLGETSPAPPPKTPSRWRAIALSAAILLFAGGIGVWRMQRETASPIAAIGVAALTAPAAEREWAAALHTQLVSRLSMMSVTPVIDLARHPASTRWRVEGRVDRSAGQYRVTMLLRDMRDGTVPWSDIFAGSPGDWVNAQSEMAMRMTEIIRYRIEGPRAGLPKRRQRLPSDPQLRR